MAPDIKYEWVIIGIVKKGRPYDFSKSIVPDPDLIPSNDSPEAKELMSNWRMDKLKNVTYTQFWALVREGHVQRVRLSLELQHNFLH